MIFMSLCMNYGCETHQSESCLDVMFNPNNLQLSADEIHFKIISTTRLNVHFTYTQALSCLTKSELILR